MSKLLSDMFVMDLKTEENPNGSYDVQGLYADLMALNAWGLNDTDVALSWNRRRDAKEAMKRLVETIEPHVKRASGSGFIQNLFKGTQGNDTDAKSLRALGEKSVAELLENGRPLDEVVDLMIYSAIGGVGSALTMVCSLIHIIYTK